MTVEQARAVRAEPVVRASFRRRIAGHLIDGVAVPAVVLVVVTALVRVRSLRLAFAVLVLGMLFWLGFTLCNSGYRQGRTGQSIGKRTVGIRLVGAVSGEPIGTWPAIVRQLAHLLDAIPLGVGYLWPLWDEQRQTFADKVCRTVVVRGGHRGP